MSPDYNFPSIPDLARGAKRRMPFFAWEYLDSGTGPEVGVARNEQALQSVQIVPEMLKGRYEPDLSTEMFGKTFSAPFGVAPVGMSGMMWPCAEFMLADAARKGEIPYTLSCVAAETPEDVAHYVGDNGWFQFYPTGDDAVRDDILRRAREAGFKVLVVTVDVPVSSTRERQARAGLAVPPKKNLATFFHAAIRPQWSLETLFHGIPRLKVLEHYAGATETLQQLLSRVLEGRPDWDYLARLRDMWDGPVVAKGIMTVADAKKCVEMGLDGIVVSNHGARQTDAAPATIEVLPDIANAVGGKTKILFDSGIRGGLDIVRARALGADFCLLGRPFLMSVGAMGWEGGPHLIRMLKADIRNNMIQLGARSFDELRTLDIRT